MTKHEIYMLVAQIGIGGSFACLTFAGFFLLLSTVQK